MRSMVNELWWTLGISILKMQVDATNSATTGRRMRQVAGTWAGLSDAAFLLVPLAGGPQPNAVAVLIAAQALATVAGPITAINQLSLRQAIIPAQVLGRVNATMRVIALGVAPLGALLAGGLGELLGLRPTLAIGALGLQLGFLVLLVSPLRTMRLYPTVHTAESLMS